MNSHHALLQTRLGLLIAVLLCISLPNTAAAQTDDRAAAPPTIETVTRIVDFQTHDGFAMQGKLTLPQSGKPRAVLIYVQTAEGATIDMKRPDGRGGTFNYFDLYRTRLPEMNVAFFSYEGRGITMGEDPPRYEKIDREIYDTSTLDNKVQDLIGAVHVAKAQPELKDSRVLLMGASEGTLLIAEAASRIPDEVDGLVMYGVMSKNMRDVFGYILTEGAFIPFRRFFDTDNDGKVSQAEFEADPRKYRERAMNGAAFSLIDKDGDGFFTVADQQVLVKPLWDAVQTENFQLLDLWASTSAAVATPKDWFKDHFAHRPMWDFVSQLEMPIGLFHGDLDANTPVAGVRELEALAKEAGKTQMEFHYFENLEHTLGIGAYFINGELPAGHQAIFEYIDAHAGPRNEAAPQRAN